MTRDERLTIEVIGAGTVGAATGQVLDEWGHDVVFKDIDDETLSALQAKGFRTETPDVAVESDLALVAVPTPYDEQAETMQTTAVEEIFETLATQDPSAVVIRSTVPPTTTKRLGEEYDIDHYGMVPEFLFADTAVEDMRSLEEVVIGTTSEYVSETVKAAFSPQVSTFVEVTPTEAEFIKFGSNLFAATKCSFSNEMWRLASETDCGDRSVTIEPDHVLAGVRQVCPWFGSDMGMEGGWAYGGHCLPKDTRGLRAWARNSQSVLVPQLSGTIAENDLIRTYDAGETEEGTATAPSMD